ncbi:hypothetical protein FXF68_41425 [Actinomadura decatromicini]|uniref:Uncharacterized protein n=1 Tax=Actinomadura decatromicini TaxID=2604572 RepID=A0A5D3F3T7_9ACTN|nr:hypothetical protein FXF68_41425 [Actinomadura decatromicini]
MIRFLAHPTPAVLIGDFIRCTCGLLGCTAVAGAICLGAVAPADAAVYGDPEPRRSLPPACRYALSGGDRHTAHKCKEAWLAMKYERSRKRSARGREFPRWMERFDRKPAVRDRPPAPGDLEEPAATPTTRSPRRHVQSSPPRAELPTPRDPSPTPARTSKRADELDSRPSSLQPVLLLGLLLPAAAAICYPFRHRLYAAAGWPAPTDPPTASPPPLVYRPVLDPFTISAAGLTGPGAVASARVLALTALDDHGDSSLVVIPRPDATVLFGLGEDELLDDDTAGLFIPGNLDAALAYLETELAIRENTGANGRRLLLVADCGTEAERIKALLVRHPGAVNVIVLGTWTDEHVTVDDDGLVDAPKALASALPKRLPAMSRTEARDRLLSALARQQQDQKPPPKRRSNPRRP